MTEALFAGPLQSGIIPRGTREEVFAEIYWVFTILGTLVGAVVIGYMVYNAYKYRDDGSEREKKDRPEVGEIPSGSGKGRKLFLSFAISAVIVISLIVGTYGSLLYVENAAAGNNDVSAEDGDAMEVMAIGYRFNWTFAYPGGNESVRTANGVINNVTLSDNLHVPTNQRVQLNVTSQDVHHNIGIPELRAKTDALPGQYTQTWLNATESGERYPARCYELCGAQHSYMVSYVETMKPEDFRAWYNEQSSTNASAVGI
ncbi:MAG: cytochrome c oxidase subunit II [Halobacteriales archaeon]